MPRPRLAPALSLTMALLTARASHLAWSEARVAPDLVVHEWGTFTTVAGEDGEPMEWDPLAAASDLPSFVRNGFPKLGRTSVTVRMETPVLYFYANAPLVVSAAVGFPSGWITEWYPEALVRQSSRGIAWNRVEVWPGRTSALPVEKRPSHYYPARETDAALLKVAGPDQTEQHERFLFYRGVGRFTLPVAAHVQGERVVVRNRSDQALGALILFERQGGGMGWTAAPLPGTAASLERPRRAGALPALESALAGLLVSQGLYEREARAMIACWRDSWFEEGLRLIYVLPRSVTDQLLPLTLEPRPAELQRALIGRIELLAPERVAAIERHLLELDESALTPVRASSVAVLGRFAHPFLRQVREATRSFEVKRRADRLLSGPVQASDNSR